MRSPSLPALLALFATPIRTFRACPSSSALTTSAASARVMRVFCSSAARSSLSTTRIAVASERSMRRTRYCTTCGSTSTCRSANSLAMTPASSRSSGSRISTVAAAFSREARSGKRDAPGRRESAAPSRACCEPAARTALTAWNRPVSSSPPASASSMNSGAPAVGGGDASPIVPAVDGDRAGHLAPDRAEMRFSRARRSGQHDHRRRPVRPAIDQRDGGRVGLATRPDGRASGLRDGLRSSGSCRGLRPIVPGHRPSRPAGAAFRRPRTGGLVARGPCRAAIPGSG